MRLPTDLQGILRDRISRFSYGELTRKRPSGMTRLQEWLRSQGIQEEMDDREGFVTVKHPAAWTRMKNFTEKPHLLLVPQELAIKIETLGYIP
jgi:hypothetical protein